MSKFPRYKNLKKDTHEKLLLELCHALTKLKTSQEVALFLSDILSGDEVLMIAKRLQIARKLLQDKKYDEISEQLKVSEGTIAKVNTWLQESGDGYRLVASRMKKEIKTTDDLEYEGDYYIDPKSFAGLRRRYPLHFLLFNIFDDIIESSDKRKLKKVKATLKNIRQTEHKRDIFRRLDRIFYNKR